MERLISDVERLPDEGIEVEASSEAAPVVKAPRWLALDSFRFLAVCLMVQGHVFSTLLDAATKRQGWYPHHSFVHGYTAPMFLFGAGLAFGYTTFSKWNDHVAGGAAARKRFTRYGWLLVIGYGLHLPTLSLRQLFEIDDPERLARMLQADVLQHIGVSLAICQILVFLVRRQRVFVGLVAAMAAFAVLGAPWVWGVDLNGTWVPTWLAGYINASTGSTFPLVPWAGFTYTGILVAYAVGLRRPAARAARTSGPSGPLALDVSARVAWPFTALALVCMIVPIVLDRFGPYPWPPHNFWKVNPFFFFWRLGNVLAALALLCHAERFMRRRGWFDASATSLMARIVSGLVPWVKVIAAESLIIYVAHLVILHGSVLSQGLKHGETIHEHSHGVLGATLVSLGLFVAMVALAKIWNQSKKQPAAFRVVQIALGAVVAYLMISE